MGGRSGLSKHQDWDPVWRSVSGKRIRKTEKVKQKKRRSRKRVTHKCHTRCCYYSGFCVVTGEQKQPRVLFFLNVSVESSRKIRENVSLVSSIWLCMFFCGGSAGPFLPANSPQLCRSNTFGGINVGVERVKILFSSAEAGASLNSNGN